MPTLLFERDGTSMVPQGLEDAGSPDIVIADIPYGLKSEWILSGPRSAQPTRLLLEFLLLLPGAPIIAIAAGKGERVEHPRYRRLKRFLVGKRQIVVVARTDRSVEEMSGGSTSGCANSGRIRFA